MKLPEKQERMKEKSTNAICYEFEEFKKKSKDISSLNKELYKKWVASEDVLAFVNTMFTNCNKDCNFLEEHDEELMKIHVKEHFKVLKRIDEEQRGNVEQLQKDKDVVVNEIRLGLSVLETQEKACGLNHLGVKIALNNAIKLLNKSFDEVFGCEKPTKDEVSVKCHMGISSVVGSQNHFDMAIDCMVCGKQIGFRGFCGKECHDKYYDELCSSADAKQEARKC